MSDLTMLRWVLGKNRTTPLADWKLDASEEADRCLVFGCPNGEGAYLQALFDPKGNLLEAKIIEGHNGESCGCKFCQRGEI